MCSGFDSVENKIDNGIDIYKHLGEKMKSDRAKIKELEAENKRLNELCNKYENPDDLTLFYMWIDEKAKDKMKELEIKYDKALTDLVQESHKRMELEERINRAIAYIEAGKCYENKEIEKAVKYIQDMLLSILRGDK